MTVLTATEVSKTLGISTRMLRYYEKSGLIESTRKDDYAYRCYDEWAVRRLQLILMLRKLRVPLKVISEILSDQDRQQVCDLLRERLSETETEIAALETIRTILQSLISRLDQGLTAQIQNRLLDDAAMMEIAKALTPVKLPLKETRINRDDLEKAEDLFTGDLRVRIVILPPATVASYHYIGENAEEIAIDRMAQFVGDSALYRHKPDARMFGFNHPEPGTGFEVYVTVPEELELPPPFTKKVMPGGIYAALTIDPPNFFEWELIMKWLEKNDRWETNYAPEGDEIMSGCYEEHLNWVYSCNPGYSGGIEEKIDLLLPIKRKSQQHREDSNESAGANQP